MKQTEQAEEQTPVVAEFVQMGMMTTGPASSDKLGTRTSALKNFLSRNTALDSLDQSEELLQTNSGSGEDPMEMVRREIVAMISKLKKENAGDQGHASWCVAEKKSTLDTLRHDCTSRSR